MIKLNAQIRNYIMYALVAVLAISLIASVIVIHRKNVKISEIKAQITMNNNLIDEENENIDEIRSKLEESEQKNSELSAQLEAAVSEKERLQKENEKLQKEIANLKAQKQAGVSNAVNNSPQSQTPPTDKICYLTFDDGPSNNTLEILKILERYNAKATFFVINTANIDYVKQINAAGHTVGLHTYSHKYNTIYSSTTAYYEDLNAISAVVEGYTGKKSTVIRFPGGSSNGVSKKYCKGIMSNLTKSVLANGYSYFDWNVSSGDAEPNTPAYTTIRDNVLSQAANKNSICVLFHDSSVKTTTVQALPEIIEGLQAMGFTRFEALTSESYGYHHHVNN